MESDESVGGTLLLTDKKEKPGYDMRLVFAVLLVTSAYASEPCLIVKHATASQQVWVSGAKLEIC